MIGAVIVAGGSGTRMQTKVKKQYLLLAGRPLLTHTVAAFDRHAELDRITLVVPPEDVDYCQTAIVRAFSWEHDIDVIAGGDRRQESVWNGIKALCGADGIVMIHDGVRPFIRPSLVARCLAGVAATGACIPAIPATDTLKAVDADGVILKTLDRQNIHLAQTPQTFSLDLIRRAHRKAMQHGFTATDDASVAEFAGESVVVVPGDPDNIKITTPHDLVFAHAILASWNADAALVPPD